MADTIILLAIFTYAATLPILFQDLEKASIFNTVTTVVSSWITEFGYPAVFLVALLENLFPPIPSEIIFPLVGFVAFHNNLGIVHAIAMGLVGAVGSTVGAIVIYYLALRVGKPAILRFGKFVGVGGKGLLKAESWFQRYGVIAVFGGRMAPAVRELISIPAGIGRMNLIKFVSLYFCRIGDLERYSNTLRLFSWRRMEGDGKPIIKCVKHSGSHYNCDCYLGIRLKVL